MGRLGTTLLLLPLTAGCPCPSLEEAQVWDPHDAISEEQAWEIRDTMLDFAAHTGVSDLCVLGVKVRPILWPNAGGMYKGDGQWILVEPDHITDSMRPIRHELCHAWDQHMGWPSLDHPDLFQVEDIERVTNYWTDEARIRESFAEACDGGPYELGIQRGLEAACAVELIGRRRRWVMDQVFVDYPERWPYQGKERFEHAPLPLGGFTHLRELVVVNDRLLALTKTEHDRDVAFWSVTPSGDGLGDEAAGSELPSGNRYHIRELDPATGETLWSFEVTDRIEPWGVEFTLLGGPGGPLLVTVTDAATRAWRLDLEQQRWSEVALPPLWGAPTGGLALADRVLIHAATRESWEQQLIEVAAVDGSWAALELEHHAAYGYGPTLFQDLGDEVLISLASGNHLSMLRYRPGLGVVEQIPISSQELTFLTALQQLPDERLVLGMLQFVELEDGNYHDQPSLILAEPDGSWRLDEASCDPRWFDEYGFVAGWATEILSVNGQLVYATASANEEGGWDWWLVHLGLPDRAPVIRGSPGSGAGGRAPRPAPRSSRG